MQRFKFWLFLLSLGWLSAACGGGGGLAPGGQASESSVVSQNGNVSVVLRVNDFALAQDLQPTPAPSPTNSPSPSPSPGAAAQLGRVFLEVADIETGRAIASADVLLNGNNQTVVLRDILRGRWLLRATGQTVDGRPLGLVVEQIVVVAPGEITRAVVNFTLQSLQLTPTNSTAALGQIVQLQVQGVFASGTPSDVTTQATYTSSNPQLVAVDSNGVATVVGAGPGSVTITASLGGVTSNAIVINVSQLNALTLLRDGNDQLLPLTIPVGGVSNLTLNATYANGTVLDVTNNSQTSYNSDANVATVVNGVVTGVAAGNTNATGTFLGQTSNPINIVVGNTATVTALSLTPATATVAVNATQTYVATATFSDATTSTVNATLSYSGPGNVNGLSVTPSQAGTFTVTGTFQGVTATASLTVVNPTFTSITLTPVNSTALVGNTVQFTAIGTQADGSQVDITLGSFWSSSNSSGATIDATGLATVLSAAPTIITVTAVDGTSATTNLFGDAQGRFYLSSRDTPRVDCMVPGETVNGNVNDFQTLTGSFNVVEKIDVDQPRDILYVADSGTGSIQVFQGLALRPGGFITSGPDREFFVTGLNAPRPLAVSSATDTVFTAEANAAVATIFVISGASTANGTINAAKQVTFGVPTGAVLNGIALDETGDRLYISQSGATPAVYCFDNFSALPATGLINPSRTITGTATSLVEPDGLAFEPTTNDILVANGTGNNVLGFPATADGNVAPGRVITAVGTPLADAADVLIYQTVNQLAVASQFNSFIFFFTNPGTVDGASVPARVLNDLSSPPSIAVDELR